jgi:hypothetical protein
MAKNRSFIIKNIKLCVYLYDGLLKLKLKLKVKRVAPGAQA